jgi:light-independent protochlorophyllide reductase subunit N
LTILNESGAPDVVSPLWGLSPLAGRLPDALFVLVGTRAEVYAALSLSGPLPGSRHTRRAAGPAPPFVLLEPDGEPEGGALASRVVEAAGSGGAPEVVLIVACRSAGLLGVDAAFEAELAERRLGIPVRAVETPGAAKNPLATDLEDAVAQTLVGLSPRGSRAFEKEEPAGKGGLLNRLRGRATGRASFGDRGTLRPVVLLGGLEASREELADELGRAGVEVVGGVPDSVRNLPEIGEGTVVAPVDPYLVRAARAAEERWRGRCCPSAWTGPPASCRTWPARPVG